VTKLTFPPVECRGTQVPKTDHHFPPNFDHWLLIQDTEAVEFVYLCELIRKRTPYIFSLYLPEMYKPKQFSQAAAERNSQQGNTN